MSTTTPSARTLALRTETSLVDRFRIWRTFIVETVVGCGAITVGILRIMRPEHWNVLTKQEAFGAIGVGLGLMGANKVWDIIKKLAR